MHLPIRGRFGFLFLAVFLSLALAAGCGSDDDDGSNGQASPNGATPTVSFAGTVGEGATPIEAIGTILLFEGLDGHLLDEDGIAECPLEDVLEIPDVTSRSKLGQFCLTFISFTPEGGITVVENMEMGGIWEFEVTKVDDVTWEVEDIEKVTDGS